MEDANTSNTQIVSETKPKTVIINNLRANLEGNFGKVFTYEEIIAILNKC